MIPPITKLNNPDLIKAASHLTTFGKLAISANNLVYLDIDDAYIHQLFPLLNNQQIQRPDYFNKGSIGAHVSVIYPEEKTPVMEKYLNKEYHFKIRELAVAEINLKNYYALLLEAPMLVQLRANHGLPDKLNFKNNWIDFHITIGVLTPS